MKAKFLRLGKDFWTFIFLAGFVNLGMWINVPEIRDPYTFYSIFLVMVTLAAAFYTRFKISKIPERTFWPAYISTTLGMLAVAFIGAWAFSYRVNEPIEAMIAYFSMQLGFQLAKATIASLYYTFTVGPVEELAFTGIGTELADSIVRGYLPKWTPGRKLLIIGLAISMVAGGFALFHYNAWVTVGNAPPEYLWVAFAANVVSLLSYRKWRNIMAQIWAHSTVDIAIVAIGGGLVIFG